MTNLQYIHTEIPEISTGNLQREEIVAEDHKVRSETEILDEAILTVKIAQLIGIKLPNGYSYQDLPYDESHDNVLFFSPLCSALLNEKINFFRSWKQFESCIKGFNALGLMAEQVRLVKKNLDTIKLSELNEIKLKFLSTREIDGCKIFTKEEISTINEEELTKISILALSTWVAFAERTIICSTSSNMGISLHDALRYMQKTNIRIFDRDVQLLNQNEGQLIIWCPDEEADFMSSEKTDFLRKLENETPKLTTLHTYINRTQRDPGALKDALETGGYFFPTNPQSTDEIQNLLFLSLSDLNRDRNQNLSATLKDPKVIATLESLKCRIEDNRLLITQGVESGISGLMVPYLLLLEQLLPESEIRAISTWNQASIGAALAAIIKLDLILRTPNKLSEITRSELYSLFPSISKFLDHRKLGKDISTRIHGVFDLANIQSLAQLLGVVVERHLSGKGTPYVGLGSSSYSNGNRCFELLKESIAKDGSFTGKDNFHPATHTLNYFAQALIYAEDLRRVSVSKKLNAFVDPSAKLVFIVAHIRKPEPAGAAALAGYLLKRLDTGTLSIVQIAHTLKLMGFRKYTFLEFCGFPADISGLKELTQLSGEEGTYMGTLCKNILNMLDWPIHQLEEKVVTERIYSEVKFSISPIDELRFADRQPMVNIYITGDNTSQPSESLAQQILEAQKNNKDLIEKHINRFSQNELGTRKHGKVTANSIKLLIRCTNALTRLSDRLSAFIQKRKHISVANKVKEISYHEHL